MIRAEKKEKPQRWSTLGRKSRVFIRCAETKCNRETRSSRSVLHSKLVTYQERHQVSSQRNSRRSELLDATVICNGGNDVAMAVSCVRLPAGALWARFCLTYRAAGSPGSVTYDHRS